MRVNYTPADAESQSWDFAPKLVRSGMAEVIEKRAGLRYDEWVDAVLAGSAKARRVLLWHLICKVHGHLKFEDTPDFAMGELTVERDLGELIEFRAVVEAFRGDEEIRARALEEIDEEIADARSNGGDIPKATSNDDELDMPSTSPPTSI